MAMVAVAVVPPAGAAEKVIVGAEVQPKSWPCGRVSALGAVVEIEPVTDPPLRIVVSAGSCMQPAPLKVTVGAAVYPVPAVGDVVTGDPNRRRSSRVVAGTPGTALPGRLRIVGADAAAARPESGKAASRGRSRIGALSFSRAARECSERA